MKVAFLDRDGTINRDYPDETWKSVAAPELLEGSIEGMRYILSRGYQIIIVSNQYIIGEGVIPPEQCVRFNQELRTMLASNGVSVLDIFSARTPEESDAHAASLRSGSSGRPFKNIRPSICLNRSCAEIPSRIYSAPKPPALNSTG